MDSQLGQARLAAGVGHVLARRLNEILEPRASSSARRTSSAGGDKVAVEQALASINQTTRERFGAAQAMLQKALAEDPDNLDIAVALASLQMRGIQMVWFSPEEAVAVLHRSLGTGRAGRGGRGIAGAVSLSATFGAARATVPDIRAPSLPRRW